MNDEGSILYDHFGMVAYEEGERLNVDYLRNILSDMIIQKGDDLELTRQLEKSKVWQSEERRTIGSIIHELQGLEQECTT